MHIHILGICGTFMGGVAQLAKQAGYTVTGSDKNVYPPMSDQLSEIGVRIEQGYAADQLAIKPDLWVIGNAVSRGNPLLEAILNAGERYTSGPQWMSEAVLQDRHVLAVAGTHGKTTTTSLLAWILSYAGLNPGFLVGGVPTDFGHSAQLGTGKTFVIEGDEYDTCFCDKRSKFIHYRPRTVILNNLEYDHADIFENLEAIEKQFHHLVRTIPSEGLIISNAKSEALERVLAKGLWSRLERFDDMSGWFVDEQGTVLKSGKQLGTLEITLAGHHNRLNALAALAAACDVGISPHQALEALSHFSGVKRRLEVKGKKRGVTVIDDFAHHPTAIRETIAALRSRMQGNGRILAVFEPRSNTMKLGTMKDKLADSLAGADKIYCYSGTGVGWNASEALAPLADKVQCFSGRIDPLVAAVVSEARQGDAVLCMSNGAFCGVQEKILNALAA